MANDTIVKVNRKAEKILDDFLNADIYVKVGVLDKPDNNAHKASDPKKDGDGVTIGRVAAIHEFGTDTIPQRSFIRSTYEKEERNLANTFRRLAKAEAKQSQPKLERFVEKVGVWFTGRVKKTFTNNNWPPLKDPTRGGRNKSGQATPLVDTGQLRASIGYEVVEGES
jgi:phage gpG-like protein